MAAPFLAWSYSRLHTFEECPKQLWHNAVAPRGHPDRIPYEQNVHQAAGEEVDNALTARVQSNTPLPEKFQKYEPMMQVLTSAPGSKIAQLELALDQSMQPCGSRDWDRCWVRIKIDYANIRGEKAYFIDYKNGQVNVDDRQLKLYAIGGFHTFPELQVIDTSYAWLKHGFTSDATYQRRELGDLWAEFLPTVERMQVAHKNNHWPARPEGKTLGGVSVCKWCNVNKAGKCPVAAVKFGGR